MFNRYSRMSFNRGQISCPDLFERSFFGRLGELTWTWRLLSLDYVRSLKADLHDIVRDGGISRSAQRRLLLTRWKALYVMLANQK